MYELLFLAGEGWDWTKLTGLAGWKEISDVIGNVANVAILVVSWGFTLFYIVKLLLATYQYFQHKKDPRKKDEAKEEVQSMATGLIVVVVGKYVLKFVLSLLGFGSTLVPGWLTISSFFIW